MRASDRRDRPAAWRPLLDAPAASVARDVALEIGAALVDPAAAGNDPRLAGGGAGVAVLHSYLARSGGDHHDRHVDATRVHLSAAIEGMATGRLNASLYAGFTGIAWTLAHLEPAPALGAFDAVDGALLRLLRRPASTWAYDLVNGLVGIGVYTLERLPDARAAALLEAVVDHLAELALWDGDGCVWRTAPEIMGPARRARHPGGVIDLGVAHGLPGAIALLGGAVGAGVAGDRARSLLEGAVTWLLSRRLTDEGGVGAFPFWIGEGASDQPARLAWCYGDLGIAAALMAAGSGAREPAWCSVAEQLALRAAARPPAGSGVVDAPLCHGAAGVAHLFARLHHATGQPPLADAARDWIARALQMRDHDAVAAASFPSRVPGGWSPRPGLLEGTAGVALALLALATDVPPQWDRILLASLPVVASA